MNNRLWLLADTETCSSGQVFDFSAVVIKFTKDYKGYEILHSIAAVVAENRNAVLWHDKNNISFFSSENLKKRHAFYDEQLKKGEYKLASVKAVNGWLEKVYRAYPDITLTCYNISFDKTACINTGITGLTSFKSICLWGISTQLFCSRVGYLKFILKWKYLTPKFNIITSAECVYRYLYQSTAPNEWREKHTGMSDLLDCEVPILQYALRQKQKLAVTPYNWRLYQLPIIMERLNIAL